MALLERKLRGGAGVLSQSRNILESPLNCAGNAVEVRLQRESLRPLGSEAGGGRGVAAGGTAWAEPGGGAAGRGGA